MVISHEELMSLKQLRCVTPDRYLLSAEIRDRLVEHGFAFQCDGFNSISAMGIASLVWAGELIEPEGK